MRRLPLLAAALVFVDTMLYAALTPLIPHFVHEFGLSKSRAGVLVAAYAGGTLVGGLIGGVASSRRGPRFAVLIGITLMGLGSFGFAFASEFWTLFAARSLQGLAAGFMWSGVLPWLVAVTPRDRRGIALGTAMGAATFGAVFGPVIGAAAALAGRPVVFAALGVICVPLAAWTLQFEPAPAEPMSFALLRRALDDRTFRIAIELVMVASLVFGVLGVLGPLHLAHAGWGAAAIGGVWLVAAALEAVETPLVGRLIDSRGSIVPSRVALAAAIGVTLLLATGARPLFYVPLIELAAIAFGPLFMTGVSLFVEGAENVGLAQGMAFGLMNSAFALGAVAGPAAGSAIAGVAGDWVPFVLAAALCSIVLVSLRGSKERRFAAKFGAPGA